MNFDFRNLDDEQKKVAILVAILLVGGLYAAFSFGLAPVFQRGRQAKMELDALRDKLDRAEMLIRREDQLAAQLEQAKTVVSEAAADHIPPVNNPLSWVAERIYGSARKVGVDIESVNGLGTTQVPWSLDVENPRAYLPYAVRVVLHCTYAEFAGLVSLIESENPYLCISEMVMAGQESDAAHHRASFTVQWPFWGDPDEAARYRAGNGGGDDA